MAQLTIHVNAKPYVVGCEDGEEDHLKALASLLDARAELRDVRPGREMAQPAAQNDCSAPSIAGRGDLVGDRAEQGRAQ